MTLRKRLCLLWYASTQEWHEKQCGECGQRWWQEGRDNHLFRPCPDCDAREFDDYLTRLERRFNQWRKEGAI